MKSFNKVTFIFFGLIIGHSDASGESWVDRVKLPSPEVEVLPNGLTIAWFLSDKVPLVDFAVLVQSGYRHDPRGKSGVAQLISATLDRGSKGQTAQQMAYAVERLGASRYVNAEDDSFTAGIHGLSQDASELLRILAEMVVSPDFVPEEVKREKTRILDRWRHVGDTGQALASLVFHRAVTSGTPYGRGGFAGAKEFSGVAREDVIEYHKKHFTPKNSVLMIVGNVKKNDFKPVIESNFSNWRGEPAPRFFSSFKNPEFLPGKNKGVLVERKDLTQAQVRMGFEAPLIDVPEHYALVVANAILGEYFNSRLNSLVRDKLALTYAIGSTFSYNKDLALFSIASSCRNEVVGQLVQNVQSVLQRFWNGPILKEEVDMAKEYLIGSFPLNTSTLSSVASRWLAGYVYGLGKDYLNEFIPKVNAVTPSDVAFAVKKYLKPDKALTVVAGDSAAIEKSLREHKLGTFRRVTKTDLK